MCEIWRWLREQNMDSATKILQIIKDLAVCIVFAWAFLWSDLIDEYVLAQKVETVSQLPILVMYPGREWHRFQVMNQGVFVVHETVVALERNGDRVPLDISCGGILHDDLKNALFDLGALKEVGLIECDVAVTFETSLGILDEDDNPYTLRVDVTYPGEAGDISLYRNDIF